MSDMTMHGSEAASVDEKDRVILSFLRRLLPGYEVSFHGYGTSGFSCDFIVDFSPAGGEKNLYEGFCLESIGNYRYFESLIRRCFSHVLELDEAALRVMHEELISELRKEYPLSIDVNVLKHLGINLYSNVPAVLTELVANAWDADTKEVDISIDTNSNVIQILDSGYGMSYRDIRNKYLRVGYERREDTGDLTPEGRPVMGRKGVGKLAPFSIANIVEVHATKGGEKSALRMNAKDIEASDGKYTAESLTTEQCPDHDGTKIILRELKKERIRVENLVQRLARRFSVIGTENFKVYVKRQDEYREVTFRDRGDLDRLQYLWIIGDWQPPEWMNIPEDRIARLDGRLEGWDQSWNVNGWIGTAHKPKNLDSTAGNLNVIAVISRGRLFDENILWQVNDGRNYLSYVAGHVEADFLDDSSKPDIATSDRQRVQEDDSRYVGLVAFVKSRLSQIESQWNKWRVIDGKKNIASRHPELETWLARMGAGHKKHAEKLLGNIMKYEMEDEQREALLENAILGFERARLSGSTSELVDSVNAGSEQLLSVLADRDSLEASLYRNIIKNRIDIIKALESRVEENDLENSIRDYIFEHLWLIDPSWERASGSEYMEKNVACEFEKIDAGLSDDERRGRMDIKYRRASGMHVIVELKRPKLPKKVSVFDLARQGHKYREALQKHLYKANLMNEPIQVVFVLGEPPAEANDVGFEATYTGQMQSVNGRIVYFQDLVNSAFQSYSEYLEKSREFDDIERVVSAIRSKGV